MGEICRSAFGAAHNKMTFPDGDSRLTLGFKLGGCLRS
ncbi:hypothetical protein [Enterobacter phage 01_vB_Eclo_IJM]|nr:hypothetical protein [Enterobacter phage 01_vB_Eclo_IJM]